MVPDLELPENPFPQGSINIGDFYVLLCAMDTSSCPVQPPESAAIKNYLQNTGRPQTDDFEVHIVWWAQLQLPNRQVA
jgi:hypothetical protein